MEGGNILCQALSGANTVVATSGLPEMEVSLTTPLKGPETEECRDPSKQREEALLQSLDVLAAPSDPWPTLTMEACFPEGINTMHKHFGGPIPLLTQHPHRFPFIYLTK